MMKTLSIAIVFALVGLAAGLLLKRDAFEQSASLEGRSAPDQHWTDVRPEESAVTLAKLQQHRSSTGTSFTFDDIADEPHVFLQVFMAYQLAANASTEDLKIWLDRSIRSDDPLYSHNLVSIFVERFTMLDPLLAIEYIESHPNFDRFIFVPHVVTSWVRHDPQGALNYFLSIQNPQMKQTIGVRLLTDPTVQKSGLEPQILAQLGANADSIVARARLARLTARLTPEQAFEEALRNRDDPRRAIANWARRDPEALLLRIDEVEDEAQRKQWLDQAYNRYSADDPQGALEHARNYHPDKPELEELVLGQLARQDPHTAQPLIDDFLARNKSNHLLNTMMQSWIRSNPTEALADAGTLGDEQRMTAYLRLAAPYVQSHPEEAFNWVLGLDAKHNEAKRMAFSNINSRTIEFAENSIDEISNSKLRTVAISSIARFKSRTDPQAALDWLSVYEQDPAYRPALQSVFSNWSHRDPESAARQIEAHIDEANMSPVVGQVAQAWYLKNNQTAMNWVTSLPDGKAKFGALSNIASMHVNQDPTEAIAMLADLPAGRLQNHAKISLAYSWVSSEPERVDEIIQTLNLGTSEAEQIRKISNKAQGFN